MKVYNVSIQRLTEIVRYYDKKKPKLTNVFKIGEPDIFIAVGERNSKKRKI